MEENVTEIETGENSTEECVEPAMNEFPRDGFTDEQRKGGAVIIHILLWYKINFVTYDMTLLHVNFNII